MTLPKNKDSYDKQVGMNTGVGVRKTAACWGKGRWFGVDRDKDAGCRGRRQEL